MGDPPPMRGLESLPETTNDWELRDWVGYCFRNHMDWSALLELTCGTLEELVRREASGRSRQGIRGSARFRRMPPRKNDVISRIERELRDEAKRLLDAADRLRGSNGRRKPRRKRQAK